MLTFKNTPQNQSRQQCKSVFTFDFLWQVLIRHLLTCCFVKADQGFNWSLFLINRIFKSCSSLFFIAIYTWKMEDLYILNYPDFLFIFLFYFFTHTCCCSTFQHKTSEYSDGNEYSDNEYRQPPQGISWEQQRKQLTTISTRLWKYYMLSFGIFLVLQHHINVKSK